MPALHVRNVDDAIVNALKARARRNHRSLEGELREILARAAFPDETGQRASDEAQGPRARGRVQGGGGRKRGRAKPDLGLATVAVDSPAGYGREEIYREEPDGDAL